MTLGVVIAALQWETEVCRDKVFFVATGFGFLVLRQGQACGQHRDKRAPSAQHATAQASYSWALFQKWKKKYKNDPRELGLSQLGIRA